MSFQVPRRRRFPQSLGDNSPYTPPDPDPIYPLYKVPVYRDYQAARMRWEESGDLEALWEMQDNVSLTWPREPVAPPRPAPPTPSITVLKPEPEPKPRGRSMGTRVAIGAFLAVALLNFLVAIGVHF